MSEALKHKIRRDLSRWSRKLLLCIGLESIGRELVGEVNWRHLYPVSSDWERDNESPVSDFDPNGPTPTPSEHNRGRGLSPGLSRLDPSASPMTDEEEDEEQKEEKNRTYESLAYLLPYWYFINRAFGVPSVAGTETVSEDLNNRNPNPLLEGLDSQQLNTLLLLHSLKQQQVLGQAQAVAPLQGVQPSFTCVPNLQEFKDPHELLKSIVGAPGQRPEFSYGSGLPRNDPARSFHEEVDQPLDLTKKRKIASEKPVGKSGQIISPEVSSSNNGGDAAAMEHYSQLNVKSSARVGRGYTTGELEAALNDIQSGKLGTRRAAVIYGIPRSTLRNKVYKLGKDRSSPYRLKGKFVPEVSLKPELGLDRRVLRRDSAKRDFGSAFGSKWSAFTAVPKTSNTQQTTAVADGRTEDVKFVEEISSEKKALKEWLQTKLSRQRLNNIDSPNIEYLSNDGDRVLPAPIVGNSSCSSDSSDDATQDCDRNLLNTIPRSTDPRHCETSRKRLKRRFYEDDGEQSSPSPRNAQLQPQPSTLTSPMNIVPNWQTLKINDDDCSMDELDRGVEKGRQECYDAFDQMSDGDGNEKKSRPKRGKYRNYDREALVKAVKAVQQGEMSVHRAGSHFGVPHSTLEYKVKERHLLRRPKRKDNTPSSKQSQKSSPESSLSGSEPGSSTPRLEFSPLASNTRETLSRFLTVPGRRGSQRSPEPIDPIALRNPLPKDSKPTGERSPSPFHLHGLLRRNFDNSSLFNMTKMS